HLFAIARQDRFASGSAQQDAPACRRWATRRCGCVVIGIARSRSFFCQIFLGARRYQLQAQGSEMRAAHEIPEMDRSRKRSKFENKCPHTIATPLPGKYLEISFYNYAERAITADHQLHQVVARDVLDHPSASFGQLALTGDELNADAEIAHSTITVFQRTVHTGRQGSTHGGMLWMRRIERKKLAMLGQHGIKCRQSTSRANADGQISGIVMGHALQPRGAQKDANALGNSARGHSGESARRNYREILGSRKSNHVCGFLCRSWGDGNGGRHSIDGKGFQSRVFFYVLRAANSGQLPRQRAGLECSVHAPDVPGLPTIFSVISGEAAASRQPPLVGNSFCGFRIERGFIASCSRCMTARSSSLNHRPMSSFFSMPTPCSPVMLPPTETQ